VKTDSVTSRCVNQQTFSKRKNTSEWVKDKRRGGNGQRDEEEGRKWQGDERKAGGGVSQDMITGNNGQRGAAE